MMAVIGVEVYDKVEFQILANNWLAQLHTNM